MDTGPVTARRPRFRRDWIVLSVRVLSGTILVLAVFLLAYIWMTFDETSTARQARQIRELRQRIAHDPTDAEAHSDLGAHLVYSEQPAIRNAGLRELRKAIQLKPDCGSAYGMLGDYYVNRKDYVRAESCDLTAARLLPGESAFLGLGDVYSFEHRHREAIAAYQTAVRFEPEDDYGHYTLGCAYNDAGLRSAARAEWQEAVKITGPRAYWSDYARQMLKKYLAAKVR